MRLTGTYCLMKELKDSKKTKKKELTKNRCQTKFRKLVLQIPIHVHPLHTYGNLFIPLHRS